MRLPLTLSTQAQKLQPLLADYTAGLAMDAREMLRQITAFKENHSICRIVQTT